MIARLQLETQTMCQQMKLLGGQHDDFGCRVNAINVEELFQKYLDLNFLYEAKLNRLAPYLDTVKRNWQRAMDAGQTLFQVFTFEDQQTNAWASIVDWRSSNYGWWGQHLVSAGNPMASRAVMLSAQHAGIVRKDHLSEQNWFRPNNRMPKRVFGSIEASVGKTSASVKEYQLLEVPLSNHTAAQPGHEIVQCDSTHTRRLVDFAKAIKGDIYVRAEALDNGDLELKGVDRLYQQIGMRRYRKIWLNFNRFGEVVAALIAYRGPLGLNFSFLENRADLLVAAEALVIELPQPLCRILSQWPVRSTPISNLDISR